MQRSLAFGVLLLLVVCPGCGDSHEKLAAENLSVMKEMNSILDGVKDEATATSAKSKLKSLAEKMNDINLRESKLTAPTEAEMNTLQTKYGKEMEDVARKFQSNMMRIMFDPKINAVLKDLDETMSKLKH